MQNPEDHMSYYFPEDIIHKILLGLPTISLIRCAKVCKSWRSLIKSSTFIHTHLSRAVHSNDQNDRHLLLMAFTKGANSSMIYSLRWDNPELGEYTKLFNCFASNKQPIVCENVITSFRDLNVVGTCNGLLCLSFASKTIIIWNPCIRTFVILPSPGLTEIRDDNNISRHEFGYDSRTNDYKVLRIVKSSCGKTVCDEVEIWSLVRGSWKSLSTTAGGLAYNCPQPAASVNGAVHWLQRYQMNGTTGVVSFDMVSESFGETKIPQGLTKKPFHIVRYEENLALLVMDSEWPDSSYQMWVMKEYGVVESWTMLFTISMQGIIMKPFFFRKSGEIVLKMLGGDLLSLNPKSKKIKYFRTDRYKYHFTDYFVESLVLFGHADAISY